MKKWGRLWNQKKRMEREERERGREREREKEGVGVKNRLNEERQSPRMSECFGEKEKGRESSFSSD